MQDKRLSTEELIAQDVGARLPEGAMAQIIAGLALAWSLFQLWIASPLPFIFRIGVLDNTETRSIHLAFALLLAFLAYPAFERYAARPRTAAGHRLRAGRAAAGASSTCSSSTNSWRSGQATSPRWT
ncbi:hypothetical protein SSTU70S_01546 [Stutzerimonas stutzeri]